MNSNANRLETVREDVKTQKYEEDNTLCAKYPRNGYTFTQIANEEGVETPQTIDLICFVT